jgi:hypothetical protein
VVTLSTGGVISLNSSNDVTHVEAGGKLRITRKVITDSGKASTEVGWSFQINIFSPLDGASVPAEVNLREQLENSETYAINVNGLLLRSLCVF